MSKVLRSFSDLKDHLNSEVSSSHKIKYPKNSFEELIDGLESKGVKFNEISKLEAEKILRDYNYYYKLTVYKRNFKKCDVGKYQNLEFKYLSEIAKIDQQLRYILLHWTLDLEHAMKTYLITSITDDITDDGFKIVRSYFQSKYDKGNVKHKENILAKIKK